MAEAGTNYLPSTLAGRSAAWAGWRWLPENCCCCSTQILAVIQGPMLSGHSQGLVECEVSWRHVVSVSVLEKRRLAKLIEPMLMFVDVRACPDARHLVLLQLAGALDCTEEQAQGYLPRPL